MMSCGSQKKKVCIFLQPWELENKCDSNFILTFVVINVRYNDILIAKICRKLVEKNVYIQNDNKKKFK